MSPDDSETPDVQDDDGTPNVEDDGETADIEDDSRTPAVDEVYCRNCGEIIDAEAEICPECGVRQRSPDTGVGNQAGIAAVASLIIPGAGQVYLGHIGRGLALIVASFVAGLFSIILVGIPFLLAIWVYAIYDAYKLAENPERAE